MVKVTLERIDCDVCGVEGERYTISYPDGMKVFDRCERHARKLIALKEEAGEWTPVNGKHSGITVLTPAQIASRRSKR